MSNRNILHLIVFLAVNIVTPYAGNADTSTAAVVESVLAVNASPGAPVRITGSGFGRQRGDSRIWLGTTYGRILRWSDRQIIAAPAPNARPGVVRVRVEGLWSNAIPFQMAHTSYTPPRIAGQPHVAGVTRGSGKDANLITLTGDGFGPAQDDATVLLGGVTAPIISWSDTQVLAAIPPNAPNGFVRMRRHGAWSNPVEFNVQPRHLVLVSFLRNA